MPKINLAAHEYYPGVPWYNAEIRRPTGTGDATEFVGNIEVKPLTKAGLANKLLVKDRYGNHIAARSFTVDDVKSVPEKALSELRKIADEQLAFWRLLSDM